MINSATSTCPHQHHRRKCFLAWKRRPYAQPRDGMQMMRRRHCQAEVMVCVVLICEEVMVRAAQRQRSRWSALVALRPPTARRSLEIPQVRISSSARIPSVLGDDEQAHAPSLPTAHSVEWSATGRLGVSLAALSGLQDAAFAQARAASRLEEMLFNREYGMPQ
eukprot:scaffold148721_cov28-Tisochrysis_lutea.AAC.6